MEIESG